MTKRKVEVTILCEDRQQQVFVRRFLIKCGFHERKIRLLPLPSGEGSGEQYVRERYARAVEKYRSQAYRDLALIVMIDADRKSVAERLQQFDRRLEENSLVHRQKDERIAIFVPRRNIETWIHYLQGETVDEETAYSKLDRESDCEPCLEALREQYPLGLKQNAPPSLQEACCQWQRIRG